MNIFDTFILMTNRKSMATGIAKNLSYRTYKSDYLGLLGVKIKSFMYMAFRIFPFSLPRQTF